MVNKQVVQLQAYVLATEDAHEHYEARQAARASASLRLLDHASADDLLIHAPVEYEWIHSRDFTLAHEAAATAVFGGDNFPRPIWLLVAIAKAVPRC